MVLSALLTLLCLLSSALSSEKSAASSGDKCPDVPVNECCQQVWSRECPQNHCYTHILQKCPERKTLLFQRSIGNNSAAVNNAHLSKDLRRAPQKAEEPKCGTAEMNYHACTSKTVANKLFASCCELYVPGECQFMCQYETDQVKAKEMLTTMIKSKCSLKHLSSILYCASQNRDNRQCCQDLDLNAPQLMVGSRCLRFCDPSGTAVGRIQKEDVTCLFNWNVLMYCHHSGIREM